MTATPKTIQIFLPSGDPRGLRIAEITTRIVQVIEVPRSRLDEFGRMPESSQFGVTTSSARRAWPAWRFWVARPTAGSPGSSPTAAHSTRSNAREQQKRCLEVVARELANAFNK